MSIFKRNHQERTTPCIPVTPGESPTVITHYPGDEFCTITATEYWSMKMIGDLSLCFPAVEILDENDHVIKATFPAEWLFLKTHPAEKPPFFEQPPQDSYNGDR